LNRPNRLTRAYQRLREPLPETWILKAAPRAAFFLPVFTENNDPITGQSPQRPWILKR
jgi:hypothetical protein